MRLILLGTGRCLLLRTGRRLLLGTGRCRQLGVGQCFLLRRLLGAGPLLPPGPPAPLIPLCVRHGSSL
ncbi:hypothetical protein CP973_11755 [Streptomyces albofaciens JCM 4342]|nr:hypothetical protein CP973_11755 [Streptomyces albofaciens JCM 4342]